MTIYKAKKSFSIGNLLILIFPLILTVLNLIEGAATSLSEWVGAGMFWILGLLIVSVPLGSTLEVGKNYIGTYLFGFATTKKVFSADIEFLTYGNVFLGGFGLGKGIKFRAVSNGANKEYSLSEMIYGKEAIAHAKQVLEQ